MTFEEALERNARLGQHFVGAAAATKAALDVRLTRADIGVYAAILIAINPMTGKACPSYEVIASLTGLSEIQIRRSLRTLGEMGYIVTKRMAYYPGEHAIAHYAIGHKVDHRRLDAEISEAVALIQKERGFKTLFHNAAPTEDLGSVVSQSIYDELARRPDRTQIDTVSRPGLIQLESPIDTVSHPHRITADTVRRTQIDTVRPPHCITDDTVSPSRVYKERADAPVHADARALSSYLPSYLPSNKIKASKKNPDNQKEGFLPLEVEELRAHAGASESAGEGWLTVTSSRVKAVLNGKNGPVIRTFAGSAIRRLAEKLGISPVEAIELVREQFIVWYDQGYCGSHSAWEAQMVDDIVRRFLNVSRAASDAVIVPNIPEHALPSIHDGGWED